MKQVLAKGGSVVVEDVPAPLGGPRNILVRVAWSCVSVGTEMAGVRLSGMPLYRRALKQPENVRKVLELMRDQGVKRTWDRVTGKLAAGTPLGYSTAGAVIEVGAEVEGFRVGDRVACAGAGIANHAELIDVPVNLAVRVPDALDLDAASTVTLGAIAMQGVRRAQPTIGETFVVVGLGILGQIAVQLLKANGCRVIGVDVDPSRTAAAKANGADAVVDGTSDEYVRHAARITDGHGADGVLITAAAEGSEIVSQAFQACRKKARVVLVGDVGLDLRRSDMYGKELDFLISTSYGPGRYDPVYEEGGRDYPLPYVRWTENRNMEAYLRLLASGEVSLSGLAQERYEVQKAPQAYEALQRTGEKPLVVLLQYPESPSALQRHVALRAVKADSGRIRVALVGAGGFAQGMHLPNLLRLRDRYEVHCIMSRTGINARAAAQQWQAVYATTDFEEVLEDDRVELVIIATRHNLHAGLALRALKAGKHVLVEKPLAITEAELQTLAGFLGGAAETPVLMTGFNRRFSPAITQVKEALAGRTTPLIVNYRMNAGFLPAEHWAHGPEGGGRNIGEACHIYDLFGALTGARATEVSAHCISPSGKQWHRNDNFVATVSYADGSVCTLTYTALGDRSYPKERMDVFCDGKVLTLEDYKSLEVAGARGAGWRSVTQNKGQLEELEALASCLREGAPWPISLEEQLDATRVSFEVERRLCAA
jgi:predicted dehydrogenase/threonine dehydrogenase-like Zn-dependent dehydrogenase